MTNWTDSLARAPREEVIEVSLQLLREGLVVTTAGNVSRRLDAEHIVITPSGVRYPELKPEDLPVLRLDGTQVLGSLIPTSESGMHLEMYRMGQVAGEPVDAVIHTHAPLSTAVSTLVEEMPRIHYALASCGPSVKVAPYETYGTPELAAAARAAMTDRKACLLANHGTLAIGPDLATAYDRTSVLEWSSQVYLAAKAAGTPTMISPEGYAKIVDKLKGYGQAR